MGLVRFLNNFDCSDELVAYKYKYLELLQNIFTTIIAIFKLSSIFYYLSANIFSPRKCIQTY